MLSTKQAGIYFSTLQFIVGTYILYGSGQRVTNYDGQATFIVQIFFR